MRLQEQIEMLKETQGVENEGNTEEVDESHKRRKVTTLRSVNSQNHQWEAERLQVGGELK